MTLKKGDKVTVLYADTPEPARVVGHHRGQWYRVRFVEPKGQDLLIDVTKEDVGWMRGWGKETEHALLAAATMAETPPPPPLRHSAIAGAAAHVASRVVTALFGNPLAGAAAGAVASYLVTKKLKKPER